MIKNNNRNSRDDKSKPGNKSTGKSWKSADTNFKGKSKFEGRDDKEGAKSYAGKPSAGRSFKPRSTNDGEARSFQPKGAPSRDFKSRDNETKSRGYVRKDNVAPGAEKPFRKFDDKKGGAPRSTDNRPFRKREDDGRNDRPSFKSPYSDKAPALRGRKPAPQKVDDGLIRLNRYIANSGICSRRKADELISAGVVSVNNIVITELGHKVDPAKDSVRYNGELLKREKRVYVLLNKPKDYITTTDDPQERRTVMQLVEKASRERIYPVGRLDRNTTGLLLMTNDGDLADKLSHPRNGITKIYQVELDKSLSQGDLNKIQFGLELEDGIIKPDSVSYVAGGSKKEIGIQIHSGKNRIVRRIFEHLGYDVVKLDRVVYGNLTKKDLPRGRWRYLEEHELIQIKHLIK